MHGAYEYAFIAISVLYVVGLPVYWLGGKHRLMAALQAREANRHRVT